LNSLQFGQRAKMIKNKAHVNKQLTVEECKLIITRLQDEISVKDKRINQLITFVKSNNLEVPVEVKTPVNNPDTQSKLEEEEDDDVPLTQDELLVQEAEKQQLEKQKEQ